MIDELYLLLGTLVIVIIAYDFFIPHCLLMEQLTPVIDSENIEKFEFSLSIRSNQLLGILKSN